MCIHGIKVITSQETAVRVYKFRFFHPFSFLAHPLMNFLKENTSLQPFNTFGIDVKAKYFCSLESMEQFNALVQTDLFSNERTMFLGGGSNVLFTKDYDGLIVHNAIQGIEIPKETDES